MENIDAQRLATFSEKDLTEIIQNPFGYSTETIDSAQVELNKRIAPEINPTQGLDEEPIPGEKNSELSNDKLYNIVRLKLAGGDNVESIAQFLKNKGVSEDDAVKMLERALKSPKYKKPAKKDNSSSGIGIFGVLFIIYVIVKWMIIIFN